MWRLVSHSIHTAAFMHHTMDLLLYILVQWWCQFYYASTPIRGNWFQTNQPEQEIGWSHIWYSNFYVCYQWERYGTSTAKLDQHLSLYCGAVKTKITERTGILYGLWESCEIWFPKFTDNFGIVSSKMYLKSSYSFRPIEIMWRKMVTVQFVWPQCQWQCDNWQMWQCDFCIHYDISLYQCIGWSHHREYCLGLFLSCFTSTMLDWFISWPLLKELYLSYSVPLRPYLEKIKGCLPATGYISYPTLSVLRRIISSSECVCAYSRTFSPTRSHARWFPRNTGAFGRGVFACFCVYFQHIL